MGWFDNWFGSSSPDPNAAMGVVPISGSSPLQGPLQSGATVDSVFKYSNPALASGGQSAGLGAGLGMNMGTAQLGLGGLSALGNAWNAYQANQMAAKQFAFTKDITNTNLNNSIKSYNTQLDDRISSRAAVNGTSEADRRAYLEANRLSR